ncbi:MAG: acyl-ACP--UDP-N-acetylglucosamine O-acyltransferase [Chthonomonas sp.]|nr:acyl-ACP--UDP-N-acetylglucosamine O-acyltransferase [Chthonomonas sp.]
MANIHPSSVISSSAEIADDVIVGPFCYVDDGVVLGPGCRLDSHVTVKSGTKMGARNSVFQGAIIGGDPQDRGFQGQESYVEMGDDNVIREFVTIHRSKLEGGTTRLGNRNYLMAFVHLGHDCNLHDDITITNNVGCAGHVTIEDRANIGGMTGIHQWTRIGRAAMVAGMARITRDVPPYCVVAGDNEVIDINAVGLRRLLVTQEARRALHKAVRLLYKSELGLTHAIEIVRRDVELTPEVEYLLQFEQRRFGGKNGRGDQP